MLRYGIVVLISAACLSAAPRLRLSTEAIGPFSIVAGTNGPAQTLPVLNIGDGTFNFTLTSSATWLTATYTAGATCTKSACGQLNLTLATTTLAAGSYTAVLTVLDPKAIDVPQTITVTVSIGGNVPASLTLYAPPGGSATATFSTGNKATATSTVPWLSVSLSGAGSFDFGLPCTVTANAQTLSANTYNGTLTFTGSSFAPDNKAVPVSFIVTTSPIADASTTTLPFSVSLPTDSAAAQTEAVWIGNDGQGTLTVNGTPTVTMDTGTWLSVPYVLAEPGGLLVGISVDATGLAAGAHAGTVTVASNAANGPTVFNVALTVNGAGTGPTIAWPRIVNISNFNSNPQEEVSPGDIVAVYGTDMFEGDPYSASFPPPGPLATQVGTGNTQVLVNGLAAPIFYAAYGQINIQIPFETSVAQDAQVQVVNNSIASPIGTVPMGGRETRILRFNCIYANVCPAPYQPYGIGVNTGVGNASTSFPIPTAFPIDNPTYPSHPANIGDTIVFYAVGLGQTTPPLATGVPAPASPLPQITPPLTVCFSTQPLTTLGVCTPAQYSGATPTAVGLYQINVKIPPNAPTGDAIYMTVGDSEAVMLAIQ